MSVLTLNVSKYLRRIFLAANGANVLLALIAAFCVWQFATVDVIVWITNDSSSYLRHAFNFSEYGVVISGYRTAGYPAFLRFVYELSAIFPIDPLFLTVLLQRLLLGAALMLAVVVLRLWSLPLVIFAANPTMMAFTNLIGPEPLLASLILFYGLGTFLTYRQLVFGGRNRGAFVAIFALCCALYFYMCTVKLLIAPVGLMLAAVWWRSLSIPEGAPLSRFDGWNWVRFRLLFARPTAAPATACLAVACILLVAFLGKAAFENRAEFGVTSPAANLERGRYWGAYTLIFKDPKMRSDRTLKKYFRRGSPYKYLHRVECIGAYLAPGCVPPTHEEKRSILLRRIDGMFAASGVNPRMTQIKGVIAVFAGGRLDDLAGGAARVIEESGPRGGPEPTNFIYNHEATRVGLNAFFGAFNRGEKPAAIDGLGVPEFLKYHPHALQGWLIIPILASLIFVLRDSQWRLFGLASFAAFLIFAVAISLSFLDNWRYILPSWLALAAATMGAIADIVIRTSTRARTSPRPSVEPVAV